ncbi:MAG: ParB/RepB/Spo0J family partition protein [Candidatus Thiodiazotropha sp. (ex Dulcina madagascariensis)]|nr:ParB/RepB/Spo0J family partition protein [Candidatus Thiodiazotropha sp. (ex Dulcina madagascariensis)]
MSSKNQNLVTRAIEIVGISKLTKACGLASRNAIKTWERSGRIPIDAEIDYPGIIERETDGQVSRVDIWLGQINNLKLGIVYRVPVALLNRDTTQPRRTFDTARLDDLALSLQIDGQETPIKFDVIDGKLRIKHGERRWRAACIGKIETLDGTMDNQESESKHERTFKQIADNTGEPLKPWDWVETFQQFHEDGLKDQEIADELASRGIKGFSRSVIANYRRLLKLPVEIQEMIKSEFLTPSHGKEILLHAKHNFIKDKLVKKLTNMMDEGGHAPPSTCLDVTIRDLYQQEFPHADDNWNHEFLLAADKLDHDKYPNECPFDYANECQACKDRHTSKLSNGYEETFCTKPACYLEKCESAAKDTQNEASDDQDYEDTEDLASSDNTMDIDQACSQEIEKSTLDVVIEQEQQKKTYKRRVLDALKTAPVEDIDLILVYCAFSDEQLDGDPATLKTVASRMQLDSDEMKRVAATCVINYLLDSWVAEIGGHLGVVDKPPEHSQDENLGLEIL